MLSCPSIVLVSSGLGFIVPGLSRSGDLGFIVLGFIGPASSLNSARAPSFVKHGKKKRREPGGSEWPVPGRFSQLARAPVSSPPPPLKSLNIFEANRLRVTEPERSNEALGPVFLQRIFLIFSHFQRLTLRFLGARACAANVWPFRFSLCRASSFRVSSCWAPSCWASTCWPSPRSSARKLQITC